MIHRYTLKVRSYELDGNNHVNNANYLNYLEAARISFLEDIGINYKAFFIEGYRLFVTKICITYKVPAEINDEITIETRPIKRRKTSGIFRQTLVRETTVISEADVTWVCVNAKGKPVPLPPEFDKRELYP